MLDIATFRSEAGRDLWLAQRDVISEPHRAPLCISGVENLGTERDRLRVIFTLTGPLLVGHFVVMCGTPLCCETLAHGQIL